MIKKSDFAIENDLELLETRVEELMKAVSHLKEENHSLQDKQQVLIEERNALDEKTKLAKSRVEAMIERLKSMEVNL